MTTTTQFYPMTYGKPRVCKIIKTSETTAGSTYLLATLEGFRNEQLITRSRITNNPDEAQKVIDEYVKNDTLHRTIKAVQALHKVAPHLLTSEARRYL